MYKLLVLFFISISFISCTPKNTAFNHFEKGEVATKGVQYTKKIDILKDKEVDVIFMSTYLNKIDKDVSDKELFLVYLYFPNLQSQEIEKSGFKLLLNGKEYTNLRKIERNNENFKELMLKNYWGNYYLVEFDSFENVNNLNLQLTNQNSNNAVLNFLK